MWINALQPLTEKTTLKLVAKHIFLRKMTVADAPVILAWENNSENWEVSDTKEPFTVQEIDGFVRLPQDINSQKQLRLVICENKMGKPIGCIDLFEFKKGKSAGIGILIADKSYRNRGLATEALKQVINYCRNELKLAYIFCNIFKKNKASIRLFGNCGFQFVEQRLLNQQKVNYYQLIC